MTSEIKCRFSVSTRVADIVEPAGRRRRSAGTAESFAYLGATDHAVVLPSDEGKVLLCATDGIIAAVVETDGATDGAQLVPRKALPTSGGQCELNGKWKTTTGVRVKKTAETEVTDSPGRFPDFSKVIDAQFDLDSHFTIGINSGLLASLANAISADGKVILFIKRPTENEYSVDSVCFAVGDTGAGAIMPYSADYRAGRTLTSANGYYQQFRAFAAKLSKRWAAPSA